MGKQLLTALVLIALTVVVFLLNSGGTLALDIGFTTIRSSPAMIYLGFSTVGVIIGILIR